MSYELEQAKEHLQQTKTELREYLLTTFRNCRENPEQEASNVFQNLAGIVDRIIKRQAFALKWGSGGTAEWHRTILQLLTRWVSLEIEISALLNQALIDTE